MQFIRFLYLLAVCATVSTCATIASPEGGPRDTSAPQIDTAQSSANEQVNFLKQPILLTFNEWVVLEDAANQVLVSPPLEFRPQLRLKRRTLLFEFDEREQLRPDVTYTINFGTAIKDLTEKNPAENLRFVFSTGPNLDSLSLQGTLVDALSGTPVEKALFMLYENLADSVVYKERPLYFGKTDKEGRFQIKNIRQDTFKAFALSEVNANYRFDLPNEKIGFPDSLLRMEPGLSPVLSLSLFTEAPPIRALGVDTSARGLLKVFFNQSPAFVEVTAPDSLPALHQAIDKDTLLLWIAPDTRSTLYLLQDSLHLDTLLLSGETPGAPALPLAGLVSPRPDQQNMQQHPEQDFILRFRTPLTRLDGSGLSLFEDSLRNPVEALVYIDTVDARLLHFRYSWKENIPYRLEIQDSAVTDFYGRQLDSTLVFSFTADSRKNFGNLRLALSGLNPEFPYLLEILLADGSPYLSRILPPGADRQSLEFRTLPPQTYSLRLVEDRNGNGVWDSGNYGRQQQPERITLRKLEPLRANWDLEAEVKFEH